MSVLLSDASKTNPPSLHRGHGFLRWGIAGGFLGGLAVVAAACGSDGGDASGSASSTATGDTSGSTSTDDADSTAGSTSTAADGSSSDDGLGPGPEGEWVSLAPLAAGPRQEDAVVALGDEIYMLGGFAEGAALVPTVEAYDPRLDSWRDIADLPVPMHHPQAAAVGGRLWVLGFLTGFDFAADGRGYVYDPDTDTWADAPAMPVGTERGAGGVAVVGDAIYVLGGLRQTQTVADAWVFDTASESWFPIADLPQPRDHMVAGAIDGTVYVVGGRDGAIAGHSAALFIYDDVTDSWSEGPSMPTSRGGQAGAVMGGRLYVAGGEGNGDVSSGVFDAWEVFEPGLGWTVLTPMPTPRHGTGAAAIGGVIFVPGGADVEAFGAVATHEAWVVEP
ncbi:MAG: kelch repeat-containing protein [Deltaproteobacteria bacterium]|nr:kelch repeat-containing protein [Deltaproteobacteria bacterium]